MLTRWGLAFDNAPAPCTAQICHRTQTTTQLWRVGGLGEEDGTLPAFLALSASRMATAAVSPRTLFPRSISLKWVEYLIRLHRDKETKWLCALRGSRSLDESQPRISGNGLSFQAPSSLPAPSQAAAMTWLETGGVLSLACWTWMSLYFGIFCFS